VILFPPVAGHTLSVWITISSLAEPQGQSTSRVIWSSPLPLGEWLFWRVSEPTEPGAKYSPDSPAWDGNSQKWFLLGLNHLSLKCISIFFPEFVKGDGQHGENGWEFPNESIFLDLLKMVRSLTWDQEYPPCHRKERSLSWLFLYFSFQQTVTISVLSHHLWGD
jgi:hypothetical protein